jgi:hypothetical protein
MLTPPFANYNKNLPRQAHCYLFKQFKKKKYSNFEMKLALILGGENQASFLIGAAFP